MEVPKGEVVWQLGCKIPGAFQVVSKWVPSGFTWVSGGCQAGPDGLWVPSGIRVGSRWLPSGFQVRSKRVPSGNDCIHMHIHIERILLFALHPHLYPRAMQVGEFSDELSEAAVAY